MDELNSSGFIWSGFIWSAFSDLCLYVRQRNLKRETLHPRHRRLSAARPRLPLLRRTTAISEKQTAVRAKEKVKLSADLGRILQLHSH